MSVRCNRPDPAALVGLVADDLGDVTPPVRPFQRLQESVLEVQLEVDVGPTGVEWHVTVTTRRSPSRTPTATQSSSSAQTTSSSKTPGSSSTASSGVLFGSYPSSSQASVQSLQAAVTTTKLPARAGEIRAAEADARAAREALAQADWRLAQRAIPAPAAGLVHDTYYVVGDWVPAGSPVAAVLPAKWWTRISY